MKFAAVNSCLLNILIKILYVWRTCCEMRSRRQDSHAYVFPRATSQSSMRPTGLLYVVLQ